MGSESSRKSQQKPWTTVTSDDDLVDHLFALYFCWEYPTLASLSKEHFYADFRSGSSRYCSPLLVNALLALGSRFTDRPDVRTNPDDPFTAGDAFFEEAKKLFWEDTDHQTLTAVQAIGIMSIREASCGRDVDSRYFAGQSVRLAIEMGLHRITGDKGGDEDLRTVQLTTLWGAFSLDHAWSLTTGSLPQFSRFPMFPSKLPLDARLEEAPWAPYTDDGPDTRPEAQQPCHIRTVFNCFCELSEIIHNTLYTLHCPAKTPTSQAIIEIYNKYLQWYDNIPDALRLGINFTPKSSLSSSIYYHFAILHTFRPFLRLRILNSRILPRQLCLQAADAIQAHLRAYSSLYGLRRTPSFLPYVVLGTSRIYLAIEQLGGPGESKQGDYDSWLSAHVRTSKSVSRHAAEALKANMAALDEMAQCHRAAMVGVRMLGYLTRAWGVYKEIRGAMEGEAGAMGRTATKRAVAAGRAPDFFGQGPGEVGGGEAEEGEPAHETDMLRSALFWPAARVPPVIMPAETDLESLGFEGLNKLEGS